MLIKIILRNLFHYNKKGLNCHLEKLAIKNIFLLI